MACPRRPQPQFRRLVAGCVLDEVLSYTAAQAACANRQVQTQRPASSASTPALQCCLMLTRIVCREEENPLVLTKVVLAVIDKLAVVFQLLQKYCATLRNQFHSIVEDMKHASFFYPSRVSMR